MNKLAQLCCRFNRRVVAVLTLLALMPIQAMALMPTAEGKGSTAATSGDWLDLFTKYLDSGADVIAWGAVILAFIVVAVVTVGKFNDARKNKAEWAEVGLTAGVGTVILLFVVFLATEATKVI